MLWLIGAVAVIGVVWYFRRPPKEVRRMSNENPDEILKRIPVSHVCDCGKPRCKYKGKEHPRGPNKARGMQSEGTISKAVRRSRNRWMND